MKTHQLIEIENVKNANRVLKNLLERTRVEVVGIGLFYGKPGLGKTRWSSRTSLDNDYIYIRLELAISTKDFLKDLLCKLIHKTMPYYEVKGTTNGIYNQILDILRRDMNIIIVLDEIDYTFKNGKILATIRDLADQSLVTFVLVWMEKAKEKLVKINPHFFSRCNSFYEFQPLNLNDAGSIINELCEIKVDEQIIQYIYSRCNGTLRIINRYIDALERIAKRMKKNELSFGEIKDIITRLEA